MKVKSRKITFRLTPAQEGKFGHLLLRGSGMPSTWSDVVREGLILLSDKFPAAPPIKMSDKKPVEKLPLFDGKKRTPKKVVGTKPAGKARKKIAS